MNLIKLVADIQDTDARLAGCESENVGIGPPSPSEPLDVCAFDLATGLERRITHSPHWDAYPDIDGDRIAWLRKTGGRQANVCLYDLSTDLEIQVSHSGYAGLDGAV